MVERCQPVGALNRYVDVRTYDGLHDTGDVVGWGLCEDRGRGPVLTILTVLWWGNLLKIDAVWDCGRFRIGFQAWRLCLFSGWVGWCHEWVDLPDDSGALRKEAHGAVRFFDVFRFYFVLFASVYVKVYYRVCRNEGWRAPYID